MRTQPLIYLTLLAVVDLFVPVPILALILIWIVVQKPAWFLDLVHSLYDERSAP